MRERRILLLARYADIWKHITPHLSGLKFQIGGNVEDLATGSAVVGHGDGGRKAQILALDEGARAMVLMSCDILGGREEDLAALTIPVFLLWGEDDTVHPVEDAFRLNEMMPTSTLALVPGCGHLLPQQAPDVVGPLIADYLRNRWAGVGHGHPHAPGAVGIELGRKPPQRP